MAISNQESNSPKWKLKMHEIIFGAHTPMGKLFDIVLLIAILLSVLAVLLETVETIQQEYRDIFVIAEWVFTVLFTIEYILRIISVRRPWKYITSFMGIVDLLSTIPTYVSLIIAGPQYLLVIRTIRLLRVFRILKLTRYLSEANVMKRALRASAVKITVFIGGVMVLVMIMGTIMYIVEGPERGFTSIPRSMYWTIVTITTVGYGDIAPTTALGQALASVVMLLGYGIIAVPTGIVTGELVMAKKEDDQISRKACPDCSEEGHDENAAHCKYCGAKI